MLLSAVNYSSFNIENAIYRIFLGTREVNFENNKENHCNGLKIVLAYYGIYNR
jgi:hypothetical protein